MIAVLVALGLTEVLVRDAPSIQDVSAGNNTLGMSLGLDLSGGIHLVYEADLSEISEDRRSEAISGAKRIISERVNEFGVSEPVIVSQGEDRISVQLPGIRDMEAAVSLIGQTAQLDFRKLSPESEALARGNISLGFFPPYEQLTESAEIEWLPATGIDSTGNVTHLTGQFLKPNSYVDIDQTTNQPLVQFEFNDEGADLLDQITGELGVLLGAFPDGETINKPLGIFLDGNYVSSPSVRTRIPNGRGVIEGMEIEKARELAILLNAGALPVPLVGPIIREDIDPTLGSDSIRKSLIAGIVGLAIVLAFMIAYYRLPGALASVALLIYGILVLAAFKLIPVTLTLPGLAAFVLSIGMAVDANVLIFERLKEELRAGRTLGGAIEAGFSRAWAAIWDSNISTLITCLILWFMGRAMAEPRVMGFALTLAIGVALSMFTAIFVTRTFLRMLVGTRLALRTSLFGSQLPESPTRAREQE
jgi:preprotein translocase subunit SecD